MEYIECDKFMFDKEGLYMKKSISRIIGLTMKRKYAVIITAIDTVLMLICVILGSCRWDIVTMLIGVVLLVAAAMIRIRRTSGIAR